MAVANISVPRRFLLHEDSYHGSQPNKKHIVMCRVVRLTKLVGSSSDGWIYWHLVYNFSSLQLIQSCR
jgi:hypothetical protein